MNHLSVLLHSKGATSSRLPYILLIIIVLGNDTDLVRHKVAGVETDTKLTNHGDVTTSGHGLHEGFSSRLGNGSKVVDELVLGHTNTRVLDCDGGVGLIRDDLDEEVWLILDLVRVGDGLITNLVK